MPTNKYLISIFKIMASFDCTLRLSLNPGSENLSIRIEILQNVANRSLYQAIINRQDIFRIQPTFPQDPEGNPEYQPSDESFGVLDTFLWDSTETFTASDPEAALDYVLSKISQRLG